MKLKQGELHGVYQVNELKDGRVLGEVFNIPFVELTNQDHPNAHSLSIFGYE